MKSKRIWGLIPARGGSKSIPLKNMVELADRPLIDYVISAAQASTYITRTICSTDDDRIAEFCLSRGIEVQRRPLELAQDATPVLDVFVHMLESLRAQEGEIAGMLVILQPTSPFVLPEHVDHCVELLEGDELADSVQTVSTFPHNFHAYNQRIIEDGILRFRFPENRRVCYNKQTKPTHYVFGNLIVTRDSTLLEKDDIFGERSLPYIIPFPYAVDVDGPGDLEWAEWLLKSGRVSVEG